MCQNDKKTKNKNIIKYSDFTFIRSFDVIIGGLTPIQVNSTQFVPSSVYLEDAVSVCVKQAQAFPQWMNVFLIVTDTQTWIVGFLTFFVGIGAVHLCTGIEPKKLDIWASMTLTLRVLFGSPTNHQPKSLIFRIGYFFMLYVQLLVVTIYGAYYINFVTRVIFEPQVSTIQEILNLNYRIYASDTSSNYSDLNGNKMVKSLFFPNIFYIYSELRI